MKIISFIEDEEMIKKILKHLSLWDLKVRPPPKAKAPSVTISIDDSDFQVPFSAPPFSTDSDYPMDSYRISKPRRVILMAMISAINIVFSKLKSLRFEDQIETFPYSFRRVVLASYPQF